jgi:hypothetical protein
VGEFGQQLPAQWMAWQANEVVGLLAMLVAQPSPRWYAAAEQ